MEFRDFTTQGYTALQWAMDFLSRHAPEQYDHLQRTVAEVVFAPAICGEGTWGCVRADHPWTVYLAQAPERIASIELLLTLAHEGFHIRIGPHGEYQMFPHRCSDGACSNSLERDRDPVYGLEKILRPKLEAALRAEGLQPHLAAPVPRPVLPSQRSGWRTLLEIAAATTLVIGTGMVVAAAAERIADELGA